MGLHGGVVESGQLGKALHLDQGAVPGRPAHISGKVVPNRRFAGQTVLARQSIVKADGVGQLLILNFYQARGPFRQLLALGGDSGHPISYEAHVVGEGPLLIGQLLGESGAIAVKGVLRGVKAVEHPIYPRQRQGLFRVDRLDMPVGDGAAHQHQISHAGQREVSGVFCVAGRFSPGVVDGAAGTDDFHSRPSLIYMM